MGDIAKSLGRCPSCAYRIDIIWSLLVTGHQNESPVISMVLYSDLNVTIMLDPTKFFGIELGAQVTDKNDRYVVNGAHDAEKLQLLLEEFIKKFVLCAACDNPETTLVGIYDAFSDDWWRVVCWFEAPCWSAHTIPRPLKKTPSCEIVKLAVHAPQPTWNTSW